MLIVTCNICNEIIAGIPNVEVKPSPDQEVETAQIVTSIAAQHLEKEHTKEEAAAYLRNSGKVLWRTTLK